MKALNKIIIVSLIASIALLVLQLPFCIVMGTIQGFHTPSPKWYNELAPTVVGLPFCIIILFALVNIKTIYTTIKEFLSDF